MPSETCQFCGIEIKFRHIGGTVVPLHPVGSECVGKRLYRDDERNICHGTRCPKCESKVFFIRHNGGCAWFDDLGRPWDKHACFADISRLPTGWESRLKRGWKLCHLWLVGHVGRWNRRHFLHLQREPDRRHSTYPLTISHEAPANSVQPLCHRRSSRRENRFYEPKWHQNHDCSFAASLERQRTHADVSRRISSGGTRSTTNLYARSSSSDSRPNFDFQLNNA